MNQQSTHRDWASYNLAQTSEKLLAMRLISEAVDYLQLLYDYRGNGRPQIGLDDMLKCCISSRRTMAELKIAYAMKYIRQVPHFNSISNYLQKAELAPYLHQLYNVLAMPLSEIESTFAVDATGFSTFRKKNWLECRLDKNAYMDFKKLHVITGVRTNIITAARVTEGRRADGPYYEGMLNDTVRDFRIREVCADGAYLSNKNCQLTENIGASPFIKPWKNISMDFDSYEWSYKTPAWQRMIRFWAENKDVFLSHYHKRSNVESTFSMMKRKFLPYVRSKSQQAQYNEILCKVVCHNASVLCTAMFELGVNKKFGEIG